MPDKLLQLDVITFSSQETEALAAQIGKQLTGGEVIELVSDLGGGKTTFVRGLVKGMGSEDLVSSPTFTISQIYNSGDIQLRHFDFYRLQEAGLVGYEIGEDFNNPHIVTVIEWSSIVQHLLPKDRMTIYFSKINENGRKLIITYPKKLDYLVPMKFGL